MYRSTLLFVVCGFFGGVALATLVRLGIPETLFFFVLAGAFVLSAFVFRRSVAVRGYVLAACVCFACGLGIIRYLDVLEPIHPELRSALEHQVRLEGLILEEPVQRENGTRIVLSVDTLYREGEMRNVGGRVLVSADRSYVLSYGTRVRVDGALTLPEAFATENGRTFDYPRYLEARGISALVRYPQVEVLGQGEGNPLRGKLFELKGAFLKAVARVLPEPESTLLAGLLLGTQAALPEEINESFRIAGVSHITVLSGYNITLVADASMRALSFMPLLPRLASGGVMIILFVLMVGGGAAAVRAAVMALLVLLARATGRSYAAHRALLLAGGGMVALDPRILLGDASFQLSFLATLGLVYGSPVFERLLERVPSLAGLRGLAVSTLAAQTFVLPLILYNSGLFSVLALPANLAILPSVPVAMFLGALTGALALFSSFLAFPFAFFAELVLAYEISAANFFAALPGAYFLVPQFSPLLLIAVYVLGALGLYLWHRSFTSEEQQSVLPLRSS